MKRMLLALLAVVAVGCDGPPAQSSVESSNPAVTVELLTTFDGVRLFRVKLDGNRMIYVAVEGGRSSSASWTEQENRIAVERQSLTVLR